MDAGYKCSKCSGEMEAGFLRDRGRFGNQAGEWVAGVPEIVQKQVRYRIEAFRCTQCGYVEQYARQLLPPLGIFDLEQ